MKTTNFNMDLMIPNQINKDIIFNESLLAIDTFLKPTINKIITTPPDRLSEDEKYIISSGKYKNHICYISHKSKDIQYLSPSKYMIIFLIEDNNFMIFNGEEWESLQIDNENKLPTIDNNFTSIDQFFEAPKNKPYLSLYLNSETTLSFQNVNVPELTILIKQCYNESNALIWPENILWQDKTPHKITSTPNAMDIVKLYRLPETIHFLGMIIAQNFQF